MIYRQFVLGINRCNDDSFTSPMASVTPMALWVYFCYVSVDATLLLSLVLGHLFSFIMFMLATSLDCFVFQSITINHLASICRKISNNLHMYLIFPVIGQTFAKWNMMICIIQWKICLFRLLCLRFHSILHHAMYCLLMTWYFCVYIS